MVINKLLGLLHRQPAFHKTRCKIRSAVGCCQMKELSAHWPLAGLQHVKRVRRTAPLGDSKDSIQLEVLICPAASLAEPADAMNVDACPAALEKPPDSGAVQTAAAEQSDSAAPAILAVNALAAELASKHGLKLHTVQVLGAKYMETYSHRSSRKCMN